uniref:Ovule protein n=1 Tax=Rodentolepis nana TaxID=102285 RepID=A0A0R3TY83_RODNA
MLREIAIRIVSACVNFRRVHSGQRIVMNTEIQISILSCNRRGSSKGSKSEISPTFSRTPVDCGPSYCIRLLVEAIGEDKRLIGRGLSSARG